MNIRFAGQNHIQTEIGANGVIALCGKTATGWSVTPSSAASDCPRCLAVQAEIDAVDDRPIDCSYCEKDATWEGGEIERGVSDGDFYCGDHKGLAPGSPTRMSR